MRVPSIRPSPALPGPKHGPRRSSVEDGSRTGRHRPSTRQRRTEEDNGAMGRGILRIYLGAAPGVGKTYAMLSEAHRRVERGTDCVVAFVEHHDRPRTEVMLHGLELLP
ncbi:hypothetical protein ACFW9S_31905, partial [Streptomyces anulatus]